MTKFAQIALLLAIGLPSILSNRLFSSRDDDLKATVGVNLDDPLFVTDDRFLSLGMDSNLIRDRWETFDFNSVRLKTLAKGLTPAYMRLMGTDGDRMIFVRDDIPQKSLSEGLKGWPFPSTSFNMTSSDWDSINMWTAEVGWRLLFGINAQTRRPLPDGNGTYWDASNALELLDYSVEKGYASHLDFEFGNEPDLWKRHKMAAVSPQQRGIELLNLKNILETFYHPHFENSILVGPDTSTNGAEDNYTLIFLNTCGHILNGTSFHQYYGSGHGLEHVANHTDPTLLDTYRDDASQFVANVKMSKFPSMKMWNGETSSTGSPSGNEPNRWPLHIDMVSVPPAKLGEDFLTFKMLLIKFYGALFQNALLSGPGCAGNGSPNWLTAFLNASGKVLNATTFHQYYGGRTLSHISNYIDPQLLDTYKEDLHEVLHNVKSSTYPNLKIWNGETSSTSSSPGNEPDLYPKNKDFVRVPAAEVGAEFLEFKKILQHYYHPYFQNALLVGPDIAGTGGDEFPVKDFLDVAGPVLNATTFHEYYGGREISFLSNYTDPVLLNKYNKSLTKFIANAKSSKYPNITMWNGETSSTYSPPGNEPNDYPLYKEFAIVPPPVLGADFLEFKRILTHYYHPYFQNALLIGPDTGGNGGSDWPVKDFLDVAGPVVNATTFHQYYGGGEISFLNNYTDPGLLEGYKNYVKGFIANVKSSKYPTMTLWNGETSSTYSTPGNEPDLWLFNKHMYFIQPSQLGQEFVTFKSILNEHFSPHFEHSLLVGPDIAGTGAGNWLKEFLDVCGDLVNATTFHQYYGGQWLSEVHSYIDPELLDIYKGQLTDYIHNVRLSSKASHISMWNGETSSTYAPPGNEPNIWFPKRNFTPVPPEQLAEEFILFKTLISNLHGDSFSNSILVGPDVTLKGFDYLKSFLDHCGDVINATTFHQYYGRGADFVDVKSYIDPKILNGYRGEVKDMVDRVKHSRDSGVAVWQGETSSTVSPPGNGIDETYVAGFMLLDKLGLSARLGLSLVIRQTFYGFWFALVDQQLEPRPNYWLSLMFKRLVGREVLDGQVNMPGSVNDPARMRLYAHCTSERSGYPQGSVVMYAMNLFNDSVTLNFNASLSSGSLHQFLWTAPNGNLTSEGILLNGQMAKMVDDATLPIFKPVIRKASDGIEMPNFSMVYIVFPDVKVKKCIGGFRNK